MYASFLSIIKQLELTLPCSTTIDLNYKFLFLCLINEFFFNLSDNSFLESLKKYSDLFFPNITAADIKGPAKHPMPTSSTPAIFIKSVTKEF